MKNLTLWFLGGALAASVALNVGLWSRRSVPTEEVDAGKLGLTPEQVTRITHC